MAEFFDKMMMGINKGATTITEGSKVLMEKAKLNNEISDAENEKKQLSELLGKRVLELYNAGIQIPDELHNFCVEINKRNEIIDVAKGKIRELDEKRTMSGGEYRANSFSCVCGYNNADGAMFCAKCGKKLR